MKKRVIAIFLSLALSVSLLSGIAFADDSNCVELKEAVTEAQEAVDEALEALNEAKAIVNSSYGFSLWLADEDNENTTDAQKAEAKTAASILDGTYTGTTRSTVISYSDILEYTAIGEDGDATSLDNLSSAIDMIATGNNYRTTDDNVTGLSDLLISPVLMAISELQTNYSAGYYSSTRTLQHAQTFPVGENIAYGYTNPYAGWYTEEKAIYDAAGGSTSETGHYTNIISSSYAVTGFAITGRTMGQTFYASSSTYGTTANAYDTNTFKELLSKFEDELDDFTEEYVSEYQSAYNAAANALEAAEEAYKSAVHEYELTSWTWEDDGTGAVAKFTCTQCGETETVEAKVESVTTSATCTDDEYTTYTASAELDEAEYTDTKVITNEGSATGHDYDYNNITWEWTENYSSATATVTCKNDSTHTQTIKADITSDTTNATCTETGEIIYTATIMVDENTYTDIEKETISATGHSFTNYVSNSDATCTEDGTKTAKCDNGCGTTDTVTDEGSALGHSYADPVWTWNGYTSAAAVFTCENDSSHVESVTTAKITSSTSGSVTTYTATVTFEETEYTSTKTYEVYEITSGDNQIYYQCSGENLSLTSSGEYGKFESLEIGETEIDSSYYTAASGSTVITISADYLKSLEAGEYEVTLNYSDGIATATVTVCKHNYEGSVTDPTCTEQGYTTYTCSVCGDSYVSDYTDATGHDYGYEDASWSWDGYTSATITAVCKNDESHTDSADATITSEITTAPTCEETGVRTYTATATLGGAAYTDTKEKTVDATGHDYDYDNITWSWADDYSSATATVICSNDSSHTETITAKITKSTTDPVCEEGGVITYTATITADGVSYTDTESVTVSAIGHYYDYDNLIWEWADDLSSAAATVTCQNDSSHTITYEAEITRETTDPTCTEAGKTIYTATVTVDGNTYTDTAEEEISATGHSFTNYVSNNDATCTEDGTKTAKCDNGCGETDTVTDEGSALGHSYESVTTDPTCTQEGYVVYTCTVCGDTYTETIAATGHSYDEGVITTEATETEEGVVTYTCTVCGDTYTENIASLSSVQSLEEAIEEELENLAAEEDSEYDSDSYEQALDAYEEAIQNAQDVLSDEYATTQEIEDAIEALEEAYELLELIKAAEDAADEISSLTESDYTQSSWEAYKEAVEALSSLLADGSLDSEEMEAALVAVNEAKAALAAAESETETETEDSEDDDSEDEPETSDSNNLLLWICLAILSGLCLALTALRKKVR